MLYPIPKKIQLAPSPAKWQLASNQSVLVLVGLQNLRMQQGIQESALMANLIQLTNKAKTLDIPIIDLYGDDLMAGHTDAQANLTAFDECDRSNWCGR